MRGGYHNKKMFPFEVILGIFSRDQDLFPVCSERTHILAHIVLLLFKIGLRYSYQGVVAEDHDDSSI